MTTAELTRKDVKASVYVLYTGGTVGMVHSDPENSASPLVPVSKKDLMRYLPGLGQKESASSKEGISLKEEGIYFEVHGLADDKGQEVPPLDSSDVNATHWIYMATVIEKAYNHWDGFVILHGTDTMAYTTSALSFLLGNLSKPVVVTGSQLPMSASRTDAVQNLVNSLYIAGYKAVGLPLVPEVVICFGDSLLRGNRVRKISTSAWQGFATPNFPKLGAIGEHIKIDTELVRAPAKADFHAYKELETNVMDVGLFPGLKAKQLERLLELHELKGIVLRTFGAGNAPSYPDFLEVIGKAVDAGKVIVNVTQCPEGMVEMGLYAASSGLLERGVISGVDMTPETALAKMMWILKTETDPEEIKTQLQIDQRGEQSESLFDVRYGSSGTEANPMATVTATARPSGQFRKAKLKRAVLRISEVRFTDTQPDEKIELKVFINLPSASVETPTDDPHCAAVFAQEYQEGGTLIREVTEAVNRFVEDGRAINITLVPGQGKRIWFKGLYLALFTEA